MLVNLKVTGWIIELNSVEIQLSCNSVNMSTLLLEIYYEENR